MEGKTKNQSKIKLLEKILAKEKLDSREYARIQAVLLKLKSYSRKQTAEIAGKNAPAIGKWITLFNKQGVHALRTKKRQKPRTFTLSAKQKDQIKKLINQKTPKQLGLSGSFWTANLLKNLVWQKFRVKYKSQRSYQRLFKLCGFTYQKVQERDSRKQNQAEKHFKTRFRKRTKKGVLTISW